MWQPSVDGLSSYFDSAVVVPGLGSPRVQLQGLRRDPKTTLQMHATVVGQLRHKLLMVTCLQKADRVWH